MRRSLVSIEQSLADCARWRESAPGGGEGQDEGCPHLAGHQFQLALAIFSQRAGDRQAQPGATGCAFAGEERIEHPLAVGLGNAGAGVPDPTRYKAAPARSGRLDGGHGLRGQQAAVAQVMRLALGHPEFWPIYEEAERLNIPVATHGAPSMNLGINSFTHFAMTGALEHPIAQMIQIAMVA